MRVYNFSAGPSMLPLEVLQEAQAEFVDYKGCGMSVTEMSHRSKQFDAIHNECISLIRELMGVPENYEVLLVQGGASTQFAAIPMNLLTSGKADYVVTGNFAKKAYKEALKYGDIHVAGSSEADKFTYIPKELDIRDDADYLYICQNNTIFGTRYNKLPECKMPLVADVSSNILSEEMDVSKYGVIFAGAQKNMAPAGLTVVIVREDLAGRELPFTPKMLGYQIMIDKDSMYNTPPCWCIYMLGLVLDWLEGQGGVEGMEAIKHRKAQMLYDVIDSSKHFTCAAEKGSRSDMNVTFRSDSEELDAKFVSEAAAAGFTNLKGHRSVGGMRASIYNAMPAEGVEKLCGFLRAFDQKN